MWQKIRWQHYLIFKKKSLQLLLLIASLALLLLVEGYSGYQVHVLSEKHEQIKKDYSSLNNISFGLLSVSEWRKLIETSISNRISNFNLTDAQRDSLRKEIDKILYSLIDKAFDKIKNMDGSLGKKLEGFALRTVIDKDDIKKQVPDFSETILNKIQTPASKRRLRYIAQSKLEELGKGIYDSSVITELILTDSLLKKYNVKDVPSFNRLATTSLKQIKKKTYAFSFTAIGVILVFLGLWWLLRNKHSLQVPLYILSIIAALILLLVGLTTTMIEIDARIKSMDFHLLGTTISFSNQVLFFQSKSIWDIVMILMKSGEFDTILVGFMILCFSVLFPMLKLISTIVYLASNNKWTKHKIIKFFAFKSGKWSTADVMVVAIFMAYIGFNGVIKDQLSSLNIHTTDLTTITTNQTSLQPGYIIFIVFVLFGLALSEILHRIRRASQ
jgi:Paraquat-inducible protein A